MPVLTRERLAVALEIDQREMIRQDLNAALAEAQSVREILPELGSGWTELTGIERLKNKGDWECNCNVTRPGPRSEVRRRPRRRPLASLGIGHRKIRVGSPMELSGDDLEPGVREYIDATMERRTRKFWLARADAATREKDHAFAYQCQYAAGWMLLFQ